MDREQQPFDWGFGGSTPPQNPTPPQQPQDQPVVQRPAPQPVSQWPQQSSDPFPTAKTEKPARPVREKKARSYDEGVSYNALDLGFEEQEVRPRSVFARIAGPVITLLILGGLIGGGIYAGDNFAKDAVTGVIQDKVGETLGLDNTATEAIDVDLGGGLFVGQAVAGTIDDVAITVPQATFGELTGRLAITAAAVPVNPSQPTGTLGVQLGLDGESATAFATALQPGAAVTLGDGTLTVATKVAKTAITVAYLPSAAEGALVLTPQSITVGKTPMTPEEFAASKYGKVGATLLDPRTVCVARFLPAALTFTGLDVSATAVSITATGKNVSLARGLTTFGTCE